MAHGATARYWQFRAGIGETPESPAVWSDTANWEDGEAPSGASDFAYVTNAITAPLYIKADDAVTIYALKGRSGSVALETPCAYFISDKTLTLSATSQNPMLSGSRIYADVKAPNALTAAYYNDIIICGDMQLAYLPMANGPVQHRMDLYANVAGATRVNSIAIGDLRNAWGHLQVFAPQSSPTNMTSTWSQTEGSPYLSCGGVAHALPAGTLVHGDGIPEGAFLKRIFNSGSIEISEAVTNTIAANDVTFDAMTPYVSFNISSISRQANGQSVTLRLMKYRAEDTLRANLDTINYAYLSPAYPLGIDSLDGYEPGTLVLTKGLTSDTLPRMQLGNAHLEFAAVEGGGESGLINSSVKQTGTSSKVRLTVPSGAFGHLAGISNLVGIVRKDGEGTLTTALTNLVSLNTGTLVVEEGTLALTGVIGDSASYVKTLAVSNGATLKLPPNGLRVANFAIEDGANISGDGPLILPDGSDVAAVAAKVSALVLTQSQAGFDDTDTAYLADAIPAAASPLDEGLPVPASWMDVSVVSSLVTSNGEDQVCLLRWNDVRGEGHPYAVAASQTLFPQVVTNAVGIPHHVYIAPENSTDQTKTRSMAYQTPVNAVKAIFKVWNGNGALICAHDYKWLRAYASYSTRLFYNNGSANDVEGLYYVNGLLRTQNSGSPYCAEAAEDKSRFDPEVSEFHFGGTTLPNAKNIGYYTGGSGSARNGRDRICEMLLYTNDLTFVQRQKICAYLMKKWMHGAEPNRDYGSIANKFVSVLDGSTTLSYPVVAGAVAVVNSATGSVSLVKTGSGVLCVEDLSNAGGGLHVSGGTLKLNSARLSADALPGSPYLHLDATDQASFTFAGDSSTAVSGWTDVRGGEYLSATAISEGKYPTLVADGLNGMPAVSYPGGYQLASIADVTGLGFRETDRLYSVFKVLGGVGGGVVAGYAGVSGNPVLWPYGGEMHTVNKTLGGNSAGYNWFNANANYAIGQGTSYLPNPGGTIFRINGVDCNPTATAHHDGDVELLAYSGYDHIWSDALGCCYGERNNTYWRGEAGLNGEVILYTNTLSRASTLKVEAYLSKKWFGKDTPGYRPARTGALAVDAGATLLISGGAPITASSFACAGSVSGTVELAEGATLELMVDANGAVSPLSVSGGVDFSNGGTFTLSALPAAGVHPLASNAGASLGAWTAAGLKKGRSAKLVEVDGAVCVSVLLDGTAIIVR